MPAKRRADQTKRTPPTSPSASTSHTLGDQHHRLRHTGPSISTRSSVAASSSKPPAAPSYLEPSPESTHTEEVSHEKKPITEASSSTRKPFTKFLYVLLFLVLLLFGWYLYGVVTLLERLKEEVGWWSIIVGDSGGMARWETCEGCGLGSDRSRREGGAEAGKGDGLEGSLKVLADALGISPMQIASAVKPLISQASLTSIASKPEHKGGSEAVRILFGDNTQNDGM